MTLLSPRRLAGLLLALALAAGLAAGALAYWGGRGDGSATAALAEAQPLALQPGTPTTEVFPGGEANVAVLASNPNPFPVRIGSLVLDESAEPPFSVDPAHAGCDVSVLGFSPRDNGGAGWQVPPREGDEDGSLAIELPAALTMGAEASDACQGATFSVRLEARP